MEIAKKRRKQISRRSIAGLHELGASRIRRHWCAPAYLNSAMRQKGAQLESSAFLK